MNKRGEKLLSIWWYGVLALIGGFIVLGTFLFYGGYLDIRGLESEALANKVTLCFLEDKVNLLSEESDFFVECQLYEPLFTDNSKYFVDIYFNDRNVKLGNHAFEEDCKISSEIKAEKFPSCVEREFITSSGMEVKIVAGSNMRGNKN